MNFHSTCITNSQDGLKKPIRNKDWKCDNCILKIIPEMIPDRRNHDKSELNKDDIKNIKINLNNISFKLDTLSDSINKIDSIEKSISFISSKVDEFNVKFETILSKLKTHEKKNIELEKKCAILEREILSLSRNANTLEQQNLANNIEITGIPKTENESLIEIVNMVESKKTDAFSIHDKNKAWESITKTFNATGDHPKRTVSQVKKCWHNIKTKRKSEITSHKQAILRTGGGPAVEELIENPLIDEFANIACEIPGAIDSDTINNQNITCVTTSDGYLEFNIQPSDGNLSAESTSRIERVENQKIDDDEIHNLLKEELLLKIENERELLKRRKIETEVASYDLIFRKEKHLTEMELLKRTIKE
ncbi:hypothetical protein ACI65C_013563 [Semiaphis heraclei]